jgi:hypothetical protein
MSTGDFSPRPLGYKVARYEADDSLVLEFKNARSFTATPPYVFMAWF